MKKNLLIIILSIIIVALTTLLIIPKNTKDIQEENNNQNNYKEEDYVRNTSVILEEKECAGRKNDIEAKIENGNIIVTDNEKTIKITSKKAKYLYGTSYISCGNTILFFITEDGNLYQINQPTAKLTDESIMNNQEISLHSLNITKLASNIKAFIGTSSESDDSLGCSSRYVTVINEENKATNYNYATNCVNN